MRSRRKPYRLNLPSHRDGEENDSDSSSSASHEESKRNKYGRKKKYALPKYSFSFLVERKRKSASNKLPVRQNKGLHVRTTNRLNRKQKSASNKLLVRQNKGLHVRTTNRLNIIHTCYCGCCCINVSNACRCYFVLKTFLFAECCNGRLLSTCQRETTNM